MSDPDGCINIFGCNLDAEVPAGGVRSLDYRQIVVSARPGSWTPSVFSATSDTSRYRWEKVTPSDPDYLPPPDRLTRVIAERMRWKHALDQARQRAQESDADPPPTGRAA
jgi:hypothetical protein